jgi:hypothetical protein
MACMLAAWTLAAVMVPLMLTAFMMAMAVVAVMV